jgi:tetratricopeptide (TPR) repeat protein
MSSQNDFPNRSGAPVIRIGLRNPSSTSDSAPTANRSVALLEKALTQRPDDQRLTYFLALALYQDKNQEDSRHLFERLSADTNRSEWTTRASLMLALLRAKEKRWTHAAGTLAHMNDQPASGISFENVKRTLSDLVSFHSTDLKTFASQVRQLMQNSEFSTIAPAFWTLISRQVESGDFAAASSIVSDGFRFLPPWRTAVLSDRKLAHSVALICLMGGEPSVATAIWNDLQIQDPSDIGITHTLFVNALAQALHHEKNGDERAYAAWQKVLANAVVLLEDQQFWKNFLRRRCESYEDDSALNSSTAVCERLQLALGKWLPRDSPQGVALVWEIASAKSLRQLGGLPNITNGYVCGVQMLRQLGLTESVGSLLSQLINDASSNPGTIRITKSKASNADGSPLFHTLPKGSDLRRHTRMFSRFGAAQALLEEDSPERALSHLDEVCCERCVSYAAPENSGGEWWPRVCHEQCEHFKAENPAYAGLEEGGKRLWRDAIELALEAHMTVANQAITARPPQVETGVSHWSSALRLAGAVDERKRIEREIEDQVYAVTESLSDKSNYDDAIAVLDGTYDFWNGETRVMFGVSLGRMLNLRGVGLTRRATPDWEGALSDFQRAWKLNPQLPIRLMNLVHASRGVAIEVNGSDSREAAQILLNVYQPLLDGLGHFPQERELPSLMETVKSDLSRLRDNLKEQSIFKAAVDDDEGELEYLRLVAEIESLGQARPDLRVKVLSAIATTGTPLPETSELRIKVLNDTATAWTTIADNPPAPRIQVLGPSTNDE